MVYSCEEKTGSKLGPMMQPHLPLALAFPVFGAVVVLRRKGGGGTGGQSSRVSQSDPSLNPSKCLPIKCKKMLAYFNTKKKGILALANLNIL